MYFIATMAVAAVMAMGSSVLGTGSVANFDDLTLAAESYWNGSDYSGGFTSGNASFNNTFTDWGDGYTSWEGFAYSNLSQEIPPLTGSGAQYTAVPGSGQASENYAIGYVGWGALPTMSLNESAHLDGAYLANNNYAYYSMLNGDWAAKKFGGSTADDEDWFLLSIEGFDSQGGSTGTVEFYLADYRFADNSEDYIVAGWIWVDLSGLGEVKEITFSLSSSDNDPTYGMNTPAYFAVDSLAMAPEPTTCLLVGIGIIALLWRKH